MKLVSAIIKPFRLDEVRDALAEVGVSGIALMTAQDSPRTEILIGYIDETASNGGQQFAIRFESTSIEGDSRMQRSERTFSVQGKQLTYTMSMATKEVTELTHHLEAMLFKQDG